MDNNLLPGLWFSEVTDEHVAIDLPLRRKALNGLSTLLGRDKDSKLFAQPSAIGDRVTSNRSSCNSFSMDLKQMRPSLVYRSMCHLLLDSFATATVEYKRGGHRRYYMFITGPRNRAKTDRGVRETLPFAPPIVRLFIQTLVICLY